MMVTDFYSLSLFSEWEIHYLGNLCWEYCWFFWEVLKQIQVREWFLLPAVSNQNL